MQVFLVLLQDRHRDERDGEGERARELEENAKSIFLYSKIDGNFLKKYFVETAKVRKYGKQPQFINRLKN